MIKLYVDMSEKYVISETLLNIADAYGCTIVDDVEQAERVVCLSAKSALSLMKQTDAMIDILILPFDSDKTAIDALAARFPERIQVFYVLADDGTEGFPLLLNLWIGGDK